MTRLNPAHIVLMYGSLIAYLADFAFEFCNRRAWSPRQRPEGWE